MQVQRHAQCQALCTFVCSIIYLQWNFLHLPHECPLHKSRPRQSGPLVQSSPFPKPLINTNNMLPVSVITNRHDVVKMQVLRQAAQNALQVGLASGRFVHVVGAGDIVLVVLALAGQINSATTPDLFLPTSGDWPLYGAMVERHDGPSWLRDDDDNDDVL